MSSHITFGGYRNRKRIARHAVEWFMEHRKLNRFNTFIHIIDRRTWHEKADGFCNSIDQLSRPRYFEIELDNRMNNEHYLSILSLSLLLIEHLMSVFVCVTKTKLHFKHLTLLYGIVQS